MVDLAFPMLAEAQPNSVCMKNAVSLLFFVALTTVMLTGSGSGFTKSDGNWTLISINASNVTCGTGRGGSRNRVADQKGRTSRIPILSAGSRSVKSRTNLSLPLADAHSGVLRTLPQTQKDLQRIVVSPFAARCRRWDSNPHDLSNTGF